jgi:hypothetical protein
LAAPALPLVPAVSVALPAAPVVVPAAPVALPAAPLATVAFVSSNFAAAAPPVPVVPAVPISAARWTQPLTVTVLPLVCVELSGV